MPVNPEQTAVPARSTGRQIEYLLIASLMAITAALLFAMGIFSAAEAAEMTGDRIALATRFITADAPLHTRHATMLADRHIFFGLTLLGIAGMAATTFSLWRWQVRGLIMEARDRV